MSTRMLRQPRSENPVLPPRRLPRNLRPLQAQSTLYRNGGYEVLHLGVDDAPDD